MPGDMSQYYFTLRWHEHAESLVRTMEGQLGSVRGLLHAFWLSSTESRCKNWLAGRWRVIILMHSMLRLERYSGQQTWSKRRGLNPGTGIRSATFVLLDWVQEKKDNRKVLSKSLAFGNKSMRSLKALFVLVASLSDFLNYFPVSEWSLELSGAASEHERKTQKEASAEWLDRCAYGKGSV